MISEQMAILKLFNAAKVGSGAYKTNQHLLKRMLRNGYILEGGVNPTATLLADIESVVGIGGEKMNATLHKSWNKVATASDTQLYVEQMLHYFTTYGFEALYGTYDSKYVYIPAEDLEIPDVDIDNIPLILIRAITTDELLERIYELGGSGVALSKETIECLMVIIEENQFSLDLNVIKNRELLTKLYALYGILPTDPMEYLRAVINKLTGESLVIKNAKLIDLISKSDQKLLDKMLQSAPDDLAKIFLRYKPLFLAMKKVSRNKTFFNRLRKQADKMHEPVHADYLSTVTAKIKDGTFKAAKLEKSIGKYSVWRKVRLAYALQERLTITSDIVYKVRNGKAWVAEFTDMLDPDAMEDALAITLQAIANDIAKNVSGKTYFIPANVHYTLPATEKQFVGNVPAGTWVTSNEDLIVGAHWYNNPARVDIDVKLMDVDGAYGWDASYRSDDRAILFSGDVTDAPLPNGATELFYLKNGVAIPKLIMANFFNLAENGEPVDCQLVVAHEKASKNFHGNYTIDPSNIVISQGVTVSKKENLIGLILSVNDETRVVFSMTGTGNSASARNNKKSEQLLRFMIDVNSNPIELALVLEIAGATIVHEIPDGDYIDLSPEALGKQTIIGLFA